MRASLKTSEQSSCSAPTPLSNSPVCVLPQDRGCLFGSLTETRWASLEMRLIGTLSFNSFTPECQHTLCCVRLSLRIVIPRSSHLSGGISGDDRRGAQLVQVAMKPLPACSACWRSASLRHLRWPEEPGPAHLPHPPSLTPTLKEVGFASGLS